MQRGRDALQDHWHTCVTSLNENTRVGQLCVHSRRVSADKRSSLLQGIVRDLQY
jgi:hypothetical protein